MNVSTAPSALNAPPPSWRRALVYGLGLSGRAAARLLRRAGIDVLAIDRRSAYELDLHEWSGDDGFTLIEGGEPEQLPEDTPIDAVILSPGIPTDRPILGHARSLGIPILAELALAYRYAAGRVVAITGSNGKSTTTSLAGAILRHAGFDARVCGNIGEPFSDHVSLQVAEAPLYVVEVSSFQLETAEGFRPTAGALINLAPDHLDRHADFAAYREAKLRLFALQTEDDVAILNADDDEVMAATQDLRARRRYFSRRGPVADGCYLDGNRVVEVTPGEENRELFVSSAVPLPGPHNLENAMAAALIARAVGATGKDIRGGLTGFKGLPHRLQKVAERGGVEFFDDSKGTNVAATIGSLSGFEDGRVLIVLGGQFKGGELDDLARLVARKARHAFLIGESAEAFESALRAFPGMTSEIEKVGTLERAVERAASSARPGDVVLLSPACASFDQFSDYTQRGRVFQRLVHELEGAAHGA